MIRVLHFSDIHIHAELTHAPLRAFVGKRALAGLNLLLVRERLFRHAQEKVARLLRFAQQMRVDLAFCTGDLTALGTEGEHRAAREVLRPFEQLPLGLSLVPGNHDLYLADAVRDQRFDRHFGDLMASDSPESRVDGLFPFVRFLGDELALIGLNSAKPNPNPFVSSGHISPAQISALRDLLADPALASRRVIVGTHYGVLRASGRPDSHRHGLVNAEELLDACRVHSRVLVVHGHLHHRYVHRPTDERPWLFCAGSTTHEGREGAWIYESEGTSLRAVPVAYGPEGYRTLESEAIAL